jgi:hypothetical protein
MGKKDSTVMQDMAAAWYARAEQAVEQAKKKDGRLDERATC